MSRKTARNTDRLVDLEHMRRAEAHRAYRFHMGLRLWGHDLEKNKHAKMPFWNRRSYRAWVATK